MDWERARREDEFKEGTKVTAKEEKDGVYDGRKESERERGLARESNHVLQVTSSEEMGRNKERETSSDTEMGDEKNKTQASPSQFNPSLSFPLALSVYVSLSLSVVLKRSCADGVARVSSQSLADHPYSQIPPLINPAQQISTVRDRLGR